MSSVERYNIEAVNDGGDLFTESHKSGAGAWVRYEDHAAALAAERANYQTLLKDTCDDEEAIRKNLAEFDNSDSHHTVGPVELSEKAAAEIKRLRDQLAAERAKFAAFAGPDGEPLAVLMKVKCGEWPTDEMLEKKMPDGTMLYWILPATSALDAAKEPR